LTPWCSLASPNPAFLHAAIARLRLVGGDREPSQASCVHEPTSDRARLTKEDAVNRCLLSAVGQRFSASFLRINHLEHLGRTESTWSACPRQE
jgi:hypothetical protein